VSNPAKGGGLHNYGMAVDVTIANASGAPLPMGTPFDHFGEEAHTDREDVLLKSGKISREAFLNRRLLREVMRQAGFRTILYEWWHFNACSRSEARLYYRIIN
jgi:D-alanyl-D-alanine dipeptidase